MNFTKPERTFTLLFTVIVIAELICTSFSSLTTAHYLTKPAILTSLIIFYWLHSKRLDLTIRVTTLLALLFSLLGDILLMFTDKHPNYFLSGLVAFLLAHVMYILVFRKQKNSERPSILFVILLLSYGSILFYILKDGLSDMLIPVTIYMLVILTMVFTASRRKGVVNVISFNLVLFGAILFIISDSLIAIDKFYNEMPFSRILIMSTYAMAQYMITFGLLKQKQ